MKELEIRRKLVEEEIKERKLLEKEKDRYKSNIFKSYKTSNKSAN